jgi:tetratricopeptide (TPR) repeat protein
MLMGDHAGATQLLETADKLPNVQRWMLDRERSRLALRKGDIANAADTITRALDECGPDLETFILAADVVSADIANGDKHKPLLIKLRSLVDARIKTLPEASVIDGKLALAAKDLKGAEAAYTKALSDMENLKVSARRRAQPNFGLAALYYLNQDDPNAHDKLDLVILLDPSIYAAYAFYADILRDKNPKGAIEKARKAVDLDPDFVDGWEELGELAAKAGDKKLLGVAIGKLNEIAPDSEQLKELLPLKK